MKEAIKPALISEIMTKKVACLDPSQKILEIKHMYQKKKFHSHIPVVENDKLVGMVSLVDFMRRTGHAGLNDDEKVYHQYTVKDVMTHNPRSVGPDTSITDVARELAKGEFHAFPIVEGQKVVGIVSTADLIRYYLAENT